MNCLVNWFEVAIPMRVPRVDGLVGARWQMSSTLSESGGAHSMSSFMLRRVDVRDGSAALSVQY